MSWIKSMNKICLAVILPLMLLTGCNLFVEEHEIPLPGDRISILDLQRNLVPDTNLPAGTMVLPESWINKNWPQTGGYPNHAMGHLSLADKPQKRWERSIGAAGGRYTPLTTPPVVAEGRVFAMDARGLVTAFALQNGKEIWEQPVLPRAERDAGALGGGIGYADGKIYVTSGHKYIAALNAQTGHVLWKRKIPAPARSAPTIADGRLYVITLDSRLLVFSAADGSPLWDYTSVTESTNLLGSAAPTADNSLVVLPLSSGELFGLRPENGRIVWEDNLSAVRRAGALSSIADIRALPVLDRGMVFAVSYTGRLVAIDQVSGRRRWQREVGASETPLVAGDLVFLVTSNQQLIGMDRTSGGIYWVRQLAQYEDEEREEPIVWVGPVLAGGKLYVASSSGTVRVIDPRNGKDMGAFSLSDGVLLSPIVAAEHLIFLTKDGRLVVYK